MIRWLRGSCSHCLFPLDSSKRIQPASATLCNALMPPAIQSLLLSPKLPCFLLILQGAFFLHLQYTAGSYSRGPSRYAIGLPRSSSTRIVAARLHKRCIGLSFCHYLRSPYLCFLEVSLVWGRRRRRDLATGEQTPAQVEGSRER